MSATNSRARGRFDGFMSPPLIIVYAIVLALSALVGMKAYAAIRPEANVAVAQLLKARLPKTQISKVDCGVVDGLCEVTAGSNLFYVDRSGRYLMIGRVYDMETRQDLTATRLLEINPDTLIGGAAKANNAPSGDEAPLTRGAGAPPSAPAAPQHLSLTSLPATGAIVWGKSTGKTVTVFSDFRCGYCRALSNTLRTMNVRVVERPISVLGSRDLANQVYCAKNREEALHQAYAGEPLRNAGTCDTSGLDANEKFARAHGLSGTPVIVRSDGAMIEGYRPKEALAAFIEGGRS
ncbi:thiol:disulfide interchange protein DsbC [Sphingomonas sanguinis]|jgi:thiol:disulfide interchange protein DsbC